MAAVQLRQGVEGVRLLMMTRLRIRARSAYMSAKELESYVLVANLNSTSYSSAIYKDQLQHVLLKTINGSNFKLFIEAVSSNESVTKAVYNLSADPTEQSNIVEGFAAPEEHTGAAVATVWTVLLNRVDELAPTYYQAQTSGSFEKDARCTGAAKQCYVGTTARFLCAATAIRPMTLTRSSIQAVASICVRRCHRQRRRTISTSTSTSIHVPRPLMMIRVVLLDLLWARS